MIVNSLEKFDSPIVIVNQVYEGEDWGIVTNYVGEQDLEEDSEGRVDFKSIGWHLSITLPNCDDVDLDLVFGTPEAALEFGAKEILSGKYSSMGASLETSEGSGYDFGHYHSIA